MGWSRVQWSHSKCGVFELDHTALIMSMPWPPRCCCAMEEKWLPMYRNESHYVQLFTMIFTLTNNISEEASHLMDIWSRRVYCQILNFISYVILILCTKCWIWCTNIYYQPFSFCRSSQDYKIHMDMEKILYVKQNLLKHSGILQVSIKGTTLLLTRLSIVFEDLTKYKWF